jgi:hypothetical protein
MVTPTSWAGSRSRYIVHFPDLSPKYKGPETVAVVTELRDWHRGPLARRPAPDRPSFMDREALPRDGQLETDLVGELHGAASLQEPSDLFDVDHTGRTVAGTAQRLCPPQRAGDRLQARRALFARPRSIAIQVSERYRLPAPTLSLDDSGKQLLMSRHIRQHLVAYAARHKKTCPRQDSNLRP